MLNKYLIDPKNVMCLQGESMNKVRIVQISGFMQPLIFGAHGGVRPLCTNEPESETNVSVEQTISASGC